MILRTWFEERAITAQGHRAMVPLVDQRAGDLPAAAVQALLDAFLIRRDQRGEFAWLELTHDRLVEPIRGDNRRWFTDSRPVLATYYAAKVAEAAQASGVAEVRLRTWFGERAITEGGHRAKVQAGVDGPEELPEAAVPALLAAYLIRQDQRAEARWLELPDSRLIDPIRRDNQRWFTENLHPFQFQATQWKRRGDERKEKLLLKGPALDDAQVWARRHPDRLRPVDQEFLDASKAGLGAKDYVKLLVYQWLAIIGLGVAATGLALAWVAFHQAQQAERAAQEAKAAQQAADLQRGEAVKAQGQAEAARRQAEADRAEALRQRRQAEARLAELQTALDRQADLYSRLISQYSARASTLATASNQTALRAAGEAWKHLYSTRAPKGFALTDNQDPLEELAAYLDKTKSDAALNPTIQERLTLDLAREFGQPLRDTSSPGQAYVLKNLRRRYYADAKRVTGALAGAANLDAPEAHRNQTRFWELYFGEMAVVEGKAVEAAMIHFGKALKAKDPAQLKQFAAEVAEACDAELAQPVNLP
jgi:hypothetical protein